MRTVISSSGRECVLIILFQLYGSKAGLFESKIEDVKIHIFERLDEFQ